MRVLIVEDEVRLAENIAQILRERENFAVDLSHDGVDGFHLLATNPYDLVILDWMLPGMSGLELLQKARLKGITVPVLFLTARSRPEDVIDGLNSGSDDYLIKPFDMGELIARCKALIRRSFDQASPMVRVGLLEIDAAGKVVCYDGHRIELTAMEYQLLEYFAFKAGQVVSKEELLEHLYDFNWERFSNVIEAHVSNLRKKINPENMYHPIKTMRGQGYILSKE